MVMVVHEYKGVHFEVEPLRQLDPIALLQVGEFQAAQFGPAQAATV
jgi:hypothetical protein